MFLLDLFQKFFGSQCWRIKDRQNRHGGTLSTDSMLQAVFFESVQFVIIRMYEEAKQNEYQRPARPQY